MERMNDNELHDDDDSDGESFYDMVESPANPSTEFDEMFYQIRDDTTIDEAQPYIDEPLSPTDQFHPNFHYEILTQDEYVKLMMSYVDEVKDVLNLPLAIVKLLLHHFKWNKQRLLEQFYDHDHENFFQKAKLINPFSLKTVDCEQVVVNCLICCSDEQKSMFSLECKHIFCNDCWKTYLINQIVNEGLAYAISCPDFQCEILVDDETVMTFLDNDIHVKELYGKIILNSYVDNNPRARWCPGKNCGHIISATSLTSSYNYAQFITCSFCQTSFCFQCSQPWHDPIKCVLLKEWNKKLVDDTQTIVWIKVNTKSCPKCKVNIEKNGGCNHMTCRHCSHEFCWLCFGRWSNHSDCNRYDQNGNNIEVRDEQAIGLSRYMHYYDRFRSHEYSLELQTKLYEKNLPLLTKNQQKLPKASIQLIHKAFQTLLKCRQTLTYTYPFAYYLLKNNQSIVFEDNQANLERTCEDISRLLEQSLNKQINFDHIKKDLIEKCEYCSRRRDILIKHVKEGYRNNYWEYQDEVKNLL